MFWLILERKFGIESKSLLQGTAPQDISPFRLPSPYCCTELQFELMLGLYEYCDLSYSSKITHYAVEMTHNYNGGSGSRVASFAQLQVL